MNEEKMRELERFNEVYQIGFDDGKKAGMQRAVEMNAVKELTDEEITEMAKRKTNQILMDLLMPDVGNEKRIDWNVGCTREHLKNFAKAILRKAQEK